MSGYRCAYRMFVGGLMLALLMLIGLWGLASAPMTASAQTIFATNTPPPSPLPPTPDPLPGPVEAPLEQYALRLWLEQDLIDVLVAQLDRLANGESDQQNAVRFTLYELERRYPGAPNSLEQRRRVLDAMRAAPRASVDMRGIARPYIVAQLNTRLDEINPNSDNVLDIDGFRVQMTSLNLGDDDTGDALLTVRYPAQASEPLYTDHIIVNGVPTGAAAGYRLAPLAADVPAAPFGPVLAVELVRAADINRNGADEVVLRVERGEINDELLILGWRGGQIVSLVEPGTRLLFGALLDRPIGGPDVNVAHYRVESARWDCIGQRPVRWEWSGNFYRAVRDESAYRNLRTVGCALHEAEPLFGQLPAESIAQVNAILADDSLDDQGANRASMALAMLYYLAGQTQNAEAQAASLLTVSGDPWLNGQLEAFLDLTGGGFSPVEVCGGLLRQNPDGACDVDQVLTRFFDANPIARGQDVAVQLRDLGLPVRQAVTVSQVGLANRELIEFNLGGASWWSFAPTAPDVFVPAPADAPTGYAATPTPTDAPDVPPLVYETLARRGDLREVLGFIDNAQRARPGEPLSPESRYLQALAFDLLGDRANARRAYYDLWLEFPATTWGRLAGAHLERR